MRDAKASSSFLLRREERIPLSILMVVSYLGYCYGILAYLINPAWMSWSAFELPVLPQIGIALPAGIAQAGGVIGWISGCFVSGMDSPYFRRFILIVRSRSTSFSFS